MYVCMCVCLNMYACGSGGHALDMVWTSFLFIRGIWRAPGLICVWLSTLTTGLHDDKEVNRKNKAVLG